MSENSIFPLKFEDSKKIGNDQWPSNSDVTFRVDAFLYKKLFDPMSYAKVRAVLPEHNVFLQNMSKFMFVIFPNN